MTAQINACGDSRLRSLKQEAHWLKIMGSSHNRDDKFMFQAIAHVSMIYRDVDIV